MPRHLGSYDVHIVHTGFWKHAHLKTVAMLRTMEARRAFSIHYGQIMRSSSNITYSISNSNDTH